MTISMIVAVSENYGIGIDNKLPWNHLSQDMKWFKEKTKGKVILMGSSTWASLPFKPLPMRTNIVLSTRPDALQEGAHEVLALTPGDAVELLKAQYPDQEIIIIGGAKVYTDFMPYASRLYITRVPQVVKADTYLRIDDLMLQQQQGDYDGFRLTHRETHFDPDHVTFEIWDNNYK